MLGKRILLIVVGISTCVCAALLLARQATFNPDGVPSRLVPQYKAKVAAISERRQFVEAIGAEIQPRVSVEYAKFDFGMLDPFTKASHTFKIQNSGDAPLQIDVEGTSCECTVGDATKNKIFPGEFGQVTLTWKTNGEAKDYEQVGLIRTNDPLEPLVRLTVRGTVKSDLLVPNELAVGSINPGEAAVREFHVASQTWDDFLIDDVKCDLPAFSWEVLPVETLSKEELGVDAKSAWLVLVRTAGAQKGKFDKPLSITIRDPETNEFIERSIRVHGKVRPAISFYSPDLHRHEGLDVGTIANDQEHSFHIITRLRGPIKFPLKVLRVEPSQLQAKLESVDEEGKDYRLTITIAKGAKRCRFNLDDQQGFVEVGSPDQAGLRNWFPVHGAIVDVVRASHTASL